MSPPPTVEPCDPLSAAALVLLRAAAVEARELYPEFQTPDTPWPTNLPTPPRGIYLVAFVDSAPVACGALRPIDEQVAEVRRMFVLEGARRRGHARFVLSALEAHAMTSGFTVMRLETGNRQSAAMALYESCGFVRISPFGEYIGDPTSVCYEKRIASELSA